MSLEQLNANSFEKVIYDNEESCLVIFSRKTCHVCKEVVPVLEELQPQYLDRFGFYYVDVEEEKNLFQRFSLKGVPQILFFKDGEYQAKLAGAADEDKVIDKIEEVLES
ncbi:thioredoxin domain-containing protein [Desulfosporosinus orientis DSM 765]|uniref:Thioredoxin domain-containing protein n=1 Tax=Desulfosporosinus orientis (strain ATCC 19365 / DSM 765 / NCIMB 8382 / VKM B-1628 / Singapore I) TaxID=768706 RepID=G7WHF9_DESOD|nr:thioredoxin family protein [Desulfosporosinus orientis]AET70249.1 thioredoxin domain-containing protein [Desulfosporosinus orientis DSM 765]